MASYQIDRAPIFVVGVPRSGTTLLAAMLAAHSQLSCGPETHFFRFLRETNKALLCQRKHWPDHAVNFLFSTRHARNSIPANYGLSREQITDYLRECSPSIPAILESLTVQFMRAQGKERWVEKTPNHLPSVREIRSLFPHSPIVRIVRDPRDVALSLLDMPWGPKTIAGAFVLWLEYEAVGSEFFRSDPLCHTLRYEDLVASPEIEARRLCERIGIPFEEGMLDTSRSALDVNRTNEPWKKKVQQGFDSSSVRKWEKKMSREDIQYAEALMGDRMKAHGYPITNDFPTYCSIFPNSAAAFHSDLIRPLVENHIRFWPTHPKERPSMELYVGNPEGWLGCSSFQRVINAVRIAARVLSGRLSGRRLSWIWNPKSSRLGVCTRLLSLVLPEKTSTQLPSLMVN